MNLDLVITQLRQHVPLFGGRVAGAADFETSLHNESRMQLPAAYVVPLADDADANDLQNALRQHVVEHVAIIVEFDNSADRRGQGVTELYDSTRTALWKALLNWRIDPVRAQRGLEYGGAQRLDSDRARLFYQWVFSLQLTISDADGWQVEADPLTEIGMTFRSALSGQTLAAVDVMPPQ